MSAALRIALAVVSLGAVAAAPAPAQATSGSVGDCASHAQEAARRSGLSADIILRVMHAESRGRPRAMSHKGAMGCMQIMPGTWAYLTRRYGLGSDPWNPRMNMIGGALYLAEMMVQFGLPGAYSAYNAGPGRYRRHIVHGVPLPAETVAYTAQVSGNAPRRHLAPSGPRWQEASLFIRQPDRRPVAAVDMPTQPEHHAASEPESRATAATNGLFPLNRRRTNATEPQDRDNAGE